MQYEQMSTSELVRVYNEAAEKLGEKPVNRFSDKKTALRRVGVITEKLADAKPQEPKQRKPRKGGRRGINFLGMRQDIKASSPEERIGLKREDSIRARAFAVLREGATQEQLVAIFDEADKERGFNDKNTLRRIYEMVRIFCYYYGWGTQSSEDGKVITLVGGSE